MECLEEPLSQETFVKEAARRVMVGVLVALAEGAVEGVGPGAHPIMYLPHLLSLVPLPFEESMWVGGSERISQVAVLSYAGRPVFGASTIGELLTVRSCSTGVESPGETHQGFFVLLPVLAARSAGLEPATF
jgi:hypothetical protein